MSSNAFVQIPPVVFQLTTLQRLLLRSNPVTSLPPAVGDLRDLFELSLVKCPVESLPCHLALASKLEKFEFDADKISSPPQLIVKQGFQFMMEYMRRI